MVRVPGRRPLAAVVLLVLVLSGHGGLAAVVAQSTPLPATPVATPSTPVAATPVAGASFPVTLPDCQGGAVTFDAPPERVVTLDAYAAESLIALGFGNRVVGTGYPHPAAQISEALRDDFAAIPVLSEGLAGNTQGIPSREAIAAARPDLVLSAYAALVGGAAGQVDPTDVAALGATPFSSCSDARTESVTDIEDTYAFFEQLGLIFGVPDRAAEIVAGMRARQAAITARVVGEPPTRVFAIGTDPNDGQPIPTWGGAGLPNGIMTLAGCSNLFGDVDDDAFFPSAEEVVARDPEVLMVVTDFATDDGNALIAAIRANPVLAGTAAARDGRFVVVSHVLVGGPSPRNLDAVETLAAACHPAA